MPTGLACFRAHFRAAVTKREASSAYVCCCAAPGSHGMAAKIRCSRATDASSTGTASET